MKVKLSKQQIDAILADPEKAQEAGVKTNDPWWVIALKIVAYAIGLILADATYTATFAADGQGGSGDNSGMDG